MICKKCGKKLRRNEVFCTDCGYYNDFNETEENTNNNDDDKDLLSDDWDYDEDIDIDDSSDEKENIDIPQKKTTPTKKSKSEDERYISAYIGDDYPSIKKGFFNFLQQKK